MKEKKISYLHIVPFDYGYSFFDYLEMNNVKNLELTEQFIEEMKKAYSQNDAFKETLVVRNKKANMFKSVDAIVQNEVFHIALTENLYVFVLLNGTGCFLILDDGEENPDEDRYIEISKINAYKRRCRMPF